MISEKSKALYDKYSYPNAHLVPKGNFADCGVTNEQLYESSSPKLVCILREPNDRKKKPRWSIPEFIQRQVNNGYNGKRIYHMWKELGFWSYAIRNDFPEYSDINTLRISAEGLNCIGMTNLKKSGGGGSSKYLDIREYANSTTPLWKQELEIMNPDIILCCGTFRIVTDLLGLQVIKMDSHRGYYSVWKRDNGNSILVRFYHPAARFRKGVLYNLLKENLLELREKGLW
ncbi:MAG: hypothetical protein WC369_02715 [Dehalococcoidales bacterium]